MCCFRPQPPRNAYIWVLWLESARNPASERRYNCSLPSTPLTIFMTITAIGLVILGVIYAVFSRSSVAALDNGVGKLPCERLLSRITLFFWFYSISSVMGWNSKFSELTFALGTEHVQCSLERLPCQFAALYSVSSWLIRVSVKSMKPSS
jgi:hypothetical protein